MRESIQKRKIVLMAVLSLFVMICLSGCDILKNLIQENDQQSTLDQLLSRFRPSEAVPETMEEAENEPLIIPVAANLEGEQVILLYFADESGKTLVEEQRKIPKTLSLAKETVAQWIMGPAMSGTDRYPIVSPQTTLLGINIKNGVATVDLSAAFLETYSNVAAETALYGLVNTMTQFEAVELVKIRVDGQELEIYRGIPLGDLRANTNLVRYSGGEPTVLPVQEAPAATEKRETQSPSEINIFG